MGRRRGGDCLFRSGPAVASLQSQIDAIRSGPRWGEEAAEALLAAAERMGCSELHLVCRKIDALAQGRCEGALHTLARLPRPQFVALTQRFKSLARLETNGRGQPQEGWIERGAAPGPERSPRRLRLATLPTIHGENLIVRFPESPIQRLGLHSLGMPADLRASVEAMLLRGQGTILAAGPTGGGRTTAIYAMLLRLYESRGDRLNFTTVERTVERDLGFAAQVAVDETPGLTFEGALESALRLAPDVLMVGEVRDAATARTALEAGLEGRLVIAAFLAERAAGVPARLLAMGLDPYLVASSLNGILASRVARALCRNCRRRDAESGAYEPGGCEACAQTGFQGRTGLFEWIATTERLRDAILSQAPREQIAAEAAQAQTGDLLEAARAAVEKGVIARSEAEVLFP
ncbi:MAG: ATPase, T2SS/T4P/T4SS family [Candidatus Sumerlaeota bacterium]|nr:ATPase, T2SS/T4P/T4SS family [Candidatus Sumerlaeota bacterium]